MKQEKYYDEYVGKKIREIRIAKNVSLKKLADIIGISYQQVQKSEKGNGRVPAGRLFAIAQNLNAPIQDFYPPQQETKNPNAHLFNDKQTREIAEIFYGLEDKWMKETMLIMIKKFGENNKQEPYILD